MPTPGRLTPCLHAAATAPEAAALLLGPLAAAVDLLSVLGRVLQQLALAVRLSCLLLHCHGWRSQHRLWSRHGWRSLQFAPVMLNNG
jgi:hypothetical protein